MILNPDYQGNPLIGLLRLYVIMILETALMIFGVVFFVPIMIGVYIIERQERITKQS